MGSFSSYIDIHSHADARAPGSGDLTKVAAWMQHYRVDQLIVLPLAATMPADGEETQRILGNFKKYQGMIFRFCVLFPDDVSCTETAVELLMNQPHDSGCKVVTGISYGRNEHEWKRMIGDR